MAKVIRARHTCPYQRNAGKQATWTRQDDPGRAGPECSGCGSLHPARFMDLVRDGWLVLPDGTSDQAGIAAPATREYAARRKAEWLAAPGGTAAEIRERAALRRHGGPPVASLLDREWAQNWEPFLHGPPAGEIRFRHLKPRQRTELADLHDSGGVAIGFPGAFFITPWFMSSGDWDE